MQQMPPAIAAAADDDTAAMNIDDTVNMKEAQERVALGWQRTSETPVCFWAASNCHGTLCFVDRACIDDAIRSDHIAIQKAAGGLYSTHWRAIQAAKGPRNRVPGNTRRSCWSLTTTVAGTTCSIQRGHADASSVNSGLVALV
jgi:hypothetical protein